MATPSAFKRLQSSSPHGVIATLTEAEAEALRAAVRAVADAQRHAETAAARAKVALGDAIDAQVTLLRSLGATHGFDGDRALQLTDDNRLVPAPPRQERP